MIKKSATVIVLFFWVVACSGGGSGSGDTPELATACSISAQGTRDHGSGGSYTISGSVILEVNVSTDSDNNDIATSCADNSVIANAQTINNLTTVNGFVSFQPTAVDGDRFENFSDEYDVFRVSLQEGQIIALEVADFIPSFPEQNDIDIALFDLNANLIAMSESITAYEAISITATNDYYVIVRAYNGSSKYVLESTYNTSSFAPDINRNVLLDDLIANELILKYYDGAHSDIYGQAINVNNANRRPVLEKVNSAAAKTSFGVSVSSQEALFEEELKALNFQSYEKFKTLNRAKSLRQLPNVEYASPNFMRHIQLVPNDSFFSRQWHYDLINLPQAWDLTTGSPASGDVVVAVVDTGVYLDHEDLQNKLVTGYDFILDPSNSLDGDGIDANPDDPGDSTILGESSWHGTHVSGTVAAQTNNDTGVAGVSWGAKIMPLRVCGALGCTSYDIMQAVSYAAGLANDSGTVPAQPADVINLSLGGFGSSSAEAQLYQELYNAGVIVVAAAGNEETSALSYPASYPGVFSVSALDAEANLSYYSNFGTQIDIAAPGGDVTVDADGDGFADGVASTLVDDALGKDNRNNSYAYYEGTSMASPHVAGVFALMKAVHPTLTAQDVEVLLQGGGLTDDIGDVGRDDLYGHGMVNAFKAVQAANNLAGNGVLPPVVSSSSSLLALIGESTATFSVESIGGGSPVVTQIAADDTWLTAQAMSVDSQGLGEYQITVDRTGLVDGFYSTNLTFDFDSASSLVVKVTIVVGNIESNGETAQLYALLVDPVSFDVEYLRSVNGTDFSIDGVVAGDFLLVVSTDVDADNVFCANGEACGVYPSISDIVPIDVSGDQSGLSVTVGIVSSLGALSIPADISLDEKD